MSKTAVLALMPYCHNNLVIAWAITDFSTANSFNVWLYWERMANHSPIIPKGKFKTLWFVVYHLNQFTA